MRCNYFEEMSSTPGLGGSRLCDRIIKPVDTHVCPEVRSHAFPDFTAGQNTQGELFVKNTTAFKPEAFYANQGAASYTNGLSESCTTHAGTQNKPSIAEDGTASIRHLLNQVQQAIVAMETVAGDVDREMERVVGLLALGLAEIMVNHTAETNPGVVLNNLEKALQRGQGQEIRKIRMNPGGIDQTDAFKDNLSGLVEHFEDIRLETDAALTRGGCVVETEYGTIDATPGNQFRVLMDAFRSVIGVARSD
ncbi:MAG: hypothetical protein DRH90_08000 [Deltaproteobacteria bacterium]|nr:MAG: hypothetical protein DRH90_08000 [Deltaproteobacteria bacterium]RLC16317.1 MAG: hypothetical protein DRI24_08765 [Deltaproteobacteria bacterium]